MKYFPVNKTEMSKNVYEWGSQRAWLIPVVANAQAHQHNEVNT